MPETTAHDVGAHWDAGPIIAQDAEPVTHAASAEAMVVKGCEIETRVLSRAVKAHAEHRVFINGVKMVVF